MPGQSGQAFWLFCDTAITNLWGEPAGFIPGSTAARGTSTGPDDPIDSYPASWISGLTTIPSTRLL